MKLKNKAGGKEGRMERRENRVEGRKKIDSQCGGLASLHVSSAKVMFSSLSFPPLPRPAAALPTPLPYTVTFYLLY